MSNVIYVDFKKKEVINNRPQELADMTKRGEPIPPLYKASDTWFQPRPVIKKDKEAIRKLYDDQGK